MVIRVQRHANVSKQTTVYDGVEVGPSKWRVCGRGLNRSVHEGMKDVSNVKVHLKTRSGNVNIILCMERITKALIRQSRQSLRCSHTQIIHVFRVSEKVNFKSACSATETS